MMEIEIYLHFYVLKIETVLRVTHTNIINHSYSNNERTEKRKKGLINKTIETNNMCPFWRNGK